jgi:hypothetical protein
MRVLLAALAILVIGGSATAVQQARSAEAEAARDSARAELARDVATVRTTIADPARDGQTAATALLRHQLLVVAGEAPDATVGERLVDQLRVAADDLDDAEQAPLPERPEVLDDATTDRVFAQLAAIDGRAADLATTFREAADGAEAWLVAVRDLDAAAVAYADSTGDLPEGDDPEVVADAWRAEQQRLADYAAAVARAAENQISAPLAEAHRELVDGMSELAEDAVALLEADDVDGYNALLAERLETADPFEFGSRLDAARAAVADAAISGPLEDARARALGLLTDIEKLRQATPARFGAQGS